MDMPRHLQEHPQHPSCTNAILALLLLLIALLIPSMTWAARCGDNQCYTGYDKVMIVANVSNNYVEKAFLEHTEKNITVNSTIVTVKVGDINEDTKKANVTLLNTTAWLSIGKALRVNDTQIKVTSVQIGLDSEEYSCPTDCSGLRFLQLGEEFDMGEGLCRIRTTFSDYDFQARTITFTDDDIDTEIPFNLTGENKYGYPLSYESKILDENIWYRFRFSNTTKLLQFENPDEACPYADECAATSECNDNNTCTIDECDGQPLKCRHKLIVYCKDDDGCCPGRCDYLTDSDCEIPGDCSTDDECDDDDDCTTDACSGSPKACFNTPISACSNDDGCCPIGCNYTIDGDCKKPIICGDGACEGNETKVSCCDDCGCDVGSDCEENTCIVNQLYWAEESVKNSSEFKSWQEDMKVRGYRFKDRSYLEGDGTVFFEYIYTDGRDDLSYTGTYHADGSLEFLAPNEGSSYRLWIILIVSLPMLLFGGLMSHSFIRHKKETYYNQLLAHKYGAQPGAYPPQGVRQMQHPQPQIQMQQSQQAHIPQPQQHHPARQSNPMQQFPRRYPQQHHPAYYHPHPATQRGAVPPWPKQGRRS